jgi:N-acetylglucosaminyldiphosphoundecaprenol N-acetyl-beta-D-mannosaminyltransferase
MNSVHIFGVRVSNITVSEIIQLVDQTISSKDRAIITHVHVMGLNIAYEQEWFRSFLNASALVYCDGMGVKLGAMILSEPSLHRITMADWISKFAEHCQARGFSWFFLGNSPGASEAAAQLLSEQYPDLRIVGSFHGYFNKMSDHPDNAKVLELIKRTNPDILFVGLGMPTQEEWLLNNWSRLSTPIAITCGGVFDVLSGKNPRGPVWMHQFYLEWLARLIKSPKRYWKRYIVGNPLFLWRIIKQRMSDG